MHLDRRPSGCGKSTLLSILRSPRPADRGQLRAQRPLGRRPPALRARARAQDRLCQSFNLIGDLTVYENVELQLTYRGMKSPSTKNASWRLRKVGMSHRRSISSQLSAVSSASPCTRSAVPVVLLADEPTGNPTQRRDRQPCSASCTAKARRSAWSHDPRYAERGSIHLFDGRVVEDARAPDRRSRSQRFLARQLEGFITSTSFASRPAARPSATTRCRDGAVIADDGAHAAGLRLLPTATASASSPGVADRGDPRG